ncbi:hypothetical protein [uncultured Brevibacillus sp.]|uniref:hypothetical protein n=1 Tax=uncultured Brevibacillus sp. TaxID=169970 RepID=UPI002596D320|nr:hypothetical protein [uncultured Brevibacillus sp.]
MKKNVRRIVSSTALVTALFIPSAFAEKPSIDPSDTSSISTFDQLDKQFNLETVTEIPEDAIPPKFNSIQEAAEYLESSKQNILATNSQIIVRTGSFTSTSDAQLSATLGYTKNSSGLIELVSVKSSVTGDGAYTWKQSSYTTKKLDGGRSLGITIKGVLIKTVVVGSVVKKTDTNETVYVEI